MWNGKTALITGASGGLGEEFARQLAAKGCHLVLVARREEALQKLSSELQEAHGIKVRVIARDLSRADAARGLFLETRRRHLDIDLLINNAGFGLGGRFSETSLERTEEMLQLNITTLVALTRLYLEPMVERGAGAIVNVASTAAFQPVPYMSVYAASKAFVLSFSEGLWEECRGTGVTVMALCPGPTRTSFFEVAGVAESTMPSNTQTPPQVVATAIDGLEKARSHVISGWTNYALAQASRFVPRELATRVTGWLVKPPDGSEPEPTAAEKPARPARAARPAARKARTRRAAKA